MPTPTEKISAGLAAHEAQQNRIDLAGLAGAPRSLDELEGLAATALRHRDKLRELTQGVVNAVDRYEQTAKARWRDTGRTQDDNGVRDGLGEAKRGRLLADDVNKYRKDALRTSADERAAAVEALRDLHRKVAVVKDSWSDPVAILKRATVASPKRATYAANLQHAGPRELEIAAQDAVISGDQALGAAVLCRLDAMSRRDRVLVRLNRADLAETLVREEYGAARQAIARVEISLDEAVIADDAASGKKIAPSRKISLGLKRNDLETLVSTSADEDEPEESFEQRLDRLYPGRPPEGDKALI